MIVTCPSCRRKFNLPDDAIKSPYQKLKCSRCSHIFMVTKEEQEPERAMKAEPAESRTTTRPAVPEPEGPEAEAPRRRKGPIILLIVLVLLAVMGGGFYYYWMNYTDLFGIPMGASDKRLSIKNLQGQEIVTKEGKVFFISGIVANDSTKPRKFLILRAKLFDKDGVVLSEKDVLAGLSFSKEAVTAMQKLDVEKKVNDFKLSGEENFRAGSKKQIPFSAVFFDEGFERAKEFTIEIIESPIL
jgi:predicted Zn finger-like uncharacterized protein